MADSRILLAGLEEYYRVLERHLAQLAADFQQLDTSWRQFNAVSEGDYAEQFRAGWIRTSDRFQEYLEQTQKISEVLDERVDHLRNLNKTEASLVG